MNGRNRSPAVAGAFYPDDPVELRRSVERLLEHVGPVSGAAPPKALIVPHAGYLYSGPIAATAYARLRGVEGIERVVLLGPAHTVAVRGIAVSSADSWSTPIGDVPLDRESLARALRIPYVRTNDEAHRLEHSLEVQCPFLQTTLRDFLLVPFAVGIATRGQVAQVLDLLWGGPETLVIISSDLSHYLDYAAAKRLDAATCAAIEALDADAIGDDQACGLLPMAGLLDSAKTRRMRARTLDLRSSGDTSAVRDRVVGYGAWAFE